MDPAITLSNCMQLIHKCVVVGDRARTARSSCQRLVSRLKPLKPLLEEIRESKLLPFSGAIAGFASLENGLTKAKELLELCGGNGSHLYTVLRNKEMVSEFQDVSLDVDRALNSFVASRLSDNIRSQVWFPFLPQLHRISSIIPPSFPPLCCTCVALLKQQFDSRIVVRVHGL
jgi:hypothetical protein